MILAQWLMFARELQAVTADQPNDVLRGGTIAPMSERKQRICPMNKDHMTKRHGAGYTLARSDRDAEIANRTRITASLKEQRLKRDAEIAAAGPPVKPAKRAPKLKVAS